MAANSNVPSTLLLLLLVIVGIALSVWPKVVQDWIVDQYQSWRGIAAWNPLLPWMKSPAYPLFLRILGLLICAIVVMVLVRRD